MKPLHLTLCIFVFVFSIKSTECVVAQTEYLGMDYNTLVIGFLKRRLFLKVVWILDNDMIDTIFYTSMDKTGASCSIFRHMIGVSNPEFV